MTVDGVGSVLEGLLEVEFPLVHQDLEGGELVIAEVDRRAGHVRVDGRRKQAHIASSVLLDAVHKLALFCRTIAI